MNNSNVKSANRINLQRFAITNQNCSIDVDALFVHSNVVFIQHQGERYLLRRTRNGKLILTK